MNRAVFLDRDGTINKEVNNLRGIRNLRILPRVGQAIRYLNNDNFFVIVIANQPVVARGWITEKKLSKIHDVILRRLARSEAKIDAFYYCPHHPNANLEKYRKNCQDRKPNLGMLKKAVKKFNIDLSESFFIGDSTTDIKTAVNAGIKSILVKTGYGGQDGKFDVKPTYVANNLMDAVRIIEKEMRS